MSIENIKVYAVKHKDDSTRMKSMSGGIFTALSDKVLERNGCVYGCVLNEQFEAMHVRATTYEERNLMRGSKYVQSDLGDTFLQVQKDLEDGKEVLFSGTSCQVAGLKSFLNKEYDTLLCVDIVCHGVPSPMVWRDYVKWQEKRNRGKCKKVIFRNKERYGWSSHVETLEMDNGKVVNGNVFATIFYGHTILRPCCFKCPYKDITHPGDITIADYWGIEKAAPEFKDNKGVSLVLINTEIGEKAFELAKDQILYKATRIEDSMQPPLIKPFEEPDNRDEFWKDYYSKSFGRIVSKYGNGGFVNEVKKFPKKVKYKLKSMLSR